MPRYTGACHCGLVRFTVCAELSTVTYCNCSICSKKGYIHLIVEPSQFELLAGADALVSYRFNSGVAEHKFCGRCGIHPFYTPRSDPDKVDVNVRCLDGVDVSQLELLSFDGKHWEEAIKTAHWQTE
ncbi:MAG TPA: GFA family protein [Polyangiaceae bacterium]